LRKMEKENKREREREIEKAGERARERDRGKHRERESARARESLCVFVALPLFLSAREASWRRGFDPYAPLWFNVYHYHKQNLHFGIVPENQF